MNKYQFLSLTSFIGFIISLILGFSSGNIQGGIFIVFPVIVGTGFYGFSAVILLFLAFLFFTLDLIRSPSFSRFDHSEIDSDKEKSIKTGGIILIGPIPIVFGSNWKIVVLLVFLAIAFLIVSFFVLKSY